MLGEGESKINISELTDSKFRSEAFEAGTDEAEDSGILDSSRFAPFGDPIGKKRGASIESDRPATIAEPTQEEDSRQYLPDLPPDYIQNDQ